MATSVTTPISISTSIPRPIQTPNAILARQVITQTLTFADRTTTAIVTLGPGDPLPPNAAPAPAPAPASGGGGGGSGVSSAVIGIVVGSLVGAVVLALLLWACCSIRRRMLEQAISEYEDYDRVAAYETTMLQAPQRTYHWRFPMSIPPPPAPAYRPVPARPTYTASPSGRGRAQAQAPSSYIFYERQMRRK